MFASLTAVSAIRAQCARRAFHAAPLAMAERGTVKWFDVKKGFGFISPEDGSQELFAHHSQIKADGQFAMLEEGQNVEFTVGTSDRSGKAAAMNITGPNGSPILPRPRSDRRQDDRGFRQDDRGFRQDDRGFRQGGRRGYDRDQY